MKPAPKSIALVAAGVLAASAAFWIWQQYMSRDAQIASVHRDCLAEFAAAGAKMKSGTQPKGSGADSSTTFLRGLSEGLGRMLEDASGGVGATVCDAVRDACRGDFDGRICTAARERYP